MFDIVAWANGTVVGIIFGIFPAWWLCTSLVMKKGVYRQYLPAWLVEGFDWNPGFGFFQLILNKKAYFPLMLQITALVWLVICLGGYHIGAWNNYKNDIVQIIEIETSLSLFLLLTSFVPYFLMKRYLEKRFKKDGNLVNIVRSEPARLWNKNQIYQHLFLTAISLTVLCVLFFTSNTNVTFGTVISITTIIGIVIFIYIRLIRKSNNTK